VRALPTLLGALVLLAGIVAFSRSHAPIAAPPERVTLEPLPTTPFRAVLIQRADGEVRTREAELRAADTPPARLGATLRALRDWLRQDGLWPRELGAPRVFWLGEGHAALDFPLREAPRMTVAAEMRLLESVRRTAARGGVGEVFVLVNGRVPPTFLGQVALPDTLEE
jgi:hypothetical protein